MSHDTLRRLVSDAYNTQSAGMTVGLPRVKVDASQLRALIAHYDSLIAERDTLRAEVERLTAERQESALQTVIEIRDNEIALQLREIASLRAEVERLTAERDCPCRDCRMARLDPSVYPARREMILCPTCGNKRCPHATNHNHACTGSNDPGQEGSEYQFAWSAQAERDAIKQATIDKCVRRLSELYEDCTRDQCAAAIRARSEQGGEK